MTPEQNKLNLGCGFKKMDGFWNVDSSSKCNPDQVVDLEVTPWEWETDFFTEIYADSILEHLGQDPKVFTKIIQEMYRVSAPDATWTVVVPHHRSDLQWDDYTHVRTITPKTFTMFDQQVNVESVKRKLSDNTFGLYHEVDLEILDTNYNIINYWKQKQAEGWLGMAEMNEKLNTLANVAETVTMFIKVHKPQRYKNFVGF
jgi:predicted SAM-dependent methyltransferase